MTADLRPLRWAVALSVLLAVSCCLAVGMGPVQVPVDVVWGVLGHRLVGVPAQPTWAPTAEAIAWQVRAPRVLLAVLVGALLAVTGAALQAMVRNPLAEPYLIGVSAGASVGAAATLLFGASLTGVAAGTAGLTMGAFAGGLAAAALVLLTARIGGAVTGLRLVLAGVTVGYGLSAVTSAMVFLADRRDAARGVLFWLLGSLTGARWEVLPAAAAATAVVTAALWFWGRRLDALTLGDVAAGTLGVRPETFRLAAFVVVALGVGAAVAVSGPVGFVGLVVPHTARLLVGAVHRAMLPVAALLGALVLVWADVLARTVAGGQELPLGVVTAVVGAPALLLLVRRYVAEAGL